MNNYIISSNGAVFHLNEWTYHMDDIIILEARKIVIIKYKETLHYL